MCTRDSSNPMLLNTVALVTPLAQCRRGTVQVNHRDSLVYRPNGQSSGQISKMKVNFENCSNKKEFELLLGNLASPCFDFDKAVEIRQLSRARRIPVFSNRVRKLEAAPHHGSSDQD